MTTHPLPIAGKLPITTFDTRQLPTNSGINDSYQHRYMNERACGIILRLVSIVFVILPFCEDFGLFLREDFGGYKKMHSINKQTLLYTISWKYWRELNLAIEPKIAFAKILADLNLAVQYGIAILIYASRKFWQISIWWLYII